MRLPFLQVPQHAMACARMLARALRVPEFQGIGIAVALDAWMLEIAPTGDVSGLLPHENTAARLALAVGWEGDAAALLDALLLVGMLQRDEHADFIVYPGLEKYADALQAPKRRSDAGRAGAAARWGSKRQSDSMPSHANASDRMRSDAYTQTQTQTQTQRAEEPPYPPPGGEPAQRALLDGFPAPGEPPPKASGPDPEALQALWNRVAVPLGRPRWQSMTGRERPAKAALKACPDLSRWEAFLRWRLKDAFYRGEGGGWAGADPEWFLRAKTAREVCDFDAARPPPVPLPRGARMDTRPSDFSQLPEGGEDLGTFEVGT